MATIKFVPLKKGGNVQQLGKYLTQDEKTESKQITEIDCSRDNLKRDFQVVKELHGKTTGRDYVHMVQSFKPGEISAGKAHEIALQLQECIFKGYQVLVVTHEDKGHIHNHFVLNSVNMDTGKKWHQDAKKLYEIRGENDKLCKEHSLSIPAPNKNRYIDMKELQPAMKGESWKFKLMTEIDHARSVSHTKDEFMENMKARGHEVSWTDSRKYITYTTPEGMKCRDSKLPAEYSKEAMEHEYKRPQRQEQTARTGQTRSDIPRDNQRDRKESTKDHDRGNDRETKYRNIGVSGGEASRDERKPEERDHQESGQVRERESGDHGDGEKLRERSRGNEPESSQGDHSGSGRTERNSESGKDRGQGDKREDRDMGKSISPGASLVEAIADIARNSSRAADISGDQRDKIKHEKSEVKEKETKEREIRDYRQRGHERSR
jgi:hypothetical protein